MGFLEFQLCRKPLHFLTQSRQNHSGVAAQYHLYPVHRRRILLMVHRPGAATAALLQMILQTELSFAARYIIGSNGMAARTQRIQLPYQIKHRLGRRRVSVRTEILRPVLEPLTGHEHAWKILVGHHDPRI